MGRRAHHRLLRLLTRGLPPRAGLAAPQRLALLRPVLLLLDAPTQEEAIAVRTAAEVGRVPVEPLSLPTHLGCWAFEEPLRQAIAKHLPAYQGAGSQRIRKRVEEPFGGIKAAGGFRQTKHRGRDRVGWMFTLRAAAYNLIRLPKLLATT